MGLGDTPEDQDRTDANEMRFGMGFALLFAVFAGIVIMVLLGMWFYMDFINVIHGPEVPL